MGQITKIDWAESSWNPVTGCWHDCKYCYARNIANRFSTENKNRTFFGHVEGYFDKDAVKVLDGPVTVDGVKAAYPFGFTPTLLRYKLNEPRKWKRPRTIFVCSMADLFGEWVPNEWIREVFEACMRAPQHRYLFLTKNPSRYMRLYQESGIVLPNTIDWWYGYTIDGLREIPENRPIRRRTFASVEPIQRQPDADMIDAIAQTNWVIIGAETGRRKGKVIPKKLWIDAIAERCSAEMIPVFMKESLRFIMGDDFKQEFPWEV